MGSLFSRGSVFRVSALKAFITLDYELFFGSQTGSPSKCLFEPTEALLGVLDRHEVSATFFVDVAYLDNAAKYDECRDDVYAVVNHLRSLQSRGHELQLHIHPHWYYSVYESGQWRIDTSKYKLADLSPEKAVDVVNACCKNFTEIAGINPLAYRAGGWCIDGFSAFSEALYQSGVRVDSTIYAGGRSSSNVQGYDFRGAPDATAWRFGEDPLIIDSAGRFTELAISSVKLSQMFYWKMLVRKLIGGTHHKSFGDGRPTSMSSRQLAEYLLKGSYSVGSIDGAKAALLDAVFLTHTKKFGCGSEFVLLGHPKALTRSSLQSLDDFLMRKSGALNFSTVRSWYESWSV